MPMLTSQHPRVRTVVAITGGNGSKHAYVSGGAKWAGEGPVVVAVTQEVRQP